MNIGHPRRYSLFGITLLRAALGAYFLLHAYFIWTVYGFAGFSRLGAFLNLIITMGALLNVHLSQGFFLTGIVINAERGRAVAGGYEYSLFLAISCVSILLLGGGPFSLEGGERRSRISYD